jgi:hypothetical protein
VGVLKGHDLNVFVRMTIAKCVVIFRQEVLNVLRVSQQVNKYCEGH